MHEREIATALKGKNILVTGGTENFGHLIVKNTLCFKPINAYFSAPDL
jgi:FlaA1/EpsC-like NDP-sugar epimerase